MSRIGKKPVEITGNAKVSVSGSTVTVEAGQNKLTFTHKPKIAVKVDAAAKKVVVERKDDSREARALHGTTRALIANMIQGVTQGFTKELELNGVGWSAKVQGMKVLLTVGYADVREVPIPPGVKVEITQNRIVVKGPDIQKVGQTAAEIRKQRPPEPYNGKGIKYIDEVIVRKQGKQFAGGAA